MKGDKLSEQYIKDSGYWDSHWREASKNFTLTKQDIGYKLCSVMWRKMESKAMKVFGSFSGLNTVELGSGTGFMSLLMALRGSNVTLVDYSGCALKRAGEFFEYFGIDARLVRADILHLDESFHAKFDISMSFGLAEHFVGNERQRVIDAHLIVLRDGGAIFVSVPNALFVPYRTRMVLWKLDSKRRGRPLPLEVPFRKAELIRRVAGKVKYPEVFGCSFLSSIANWILAPQSQVFRRLASQVSSTRSIFDDHLSAGLILFAVK